MRKIRLLFAAAMALALCLSACAPGGEPPLAPTQEPAITAAPTPTEAPTQAPIEVGDPEVEANLAAMMPVLDSIVRTMGVNSGAAYEPRDADFFWSVLYLMGTNWGQTHPLVEDAGSHSIVRRQVMQEFASAAFLDYSDLLDLPAELIDAGAVTYDEGLDAYLVAHSDMGASYTRLDDYTVNADGSVEAVVGLYIEPDEYAGSLSFTLAPNPYADGIADPIYLYSVSAARDITPAA